MPERATGWRPDPDGVHELRFFSSEGVPTPLVMDGGTVGVAGSHAAAPATADAAEAHRGERGVEHSMGLAPSDPRPPAHPESQAAGGPREQAGPTYVAEPPAAAESIAATGSGLVECPDPPVGQGRRRAYIVVLVALALSVLGLALVHLPHGTHPRAAPPRHVTTTTNLTGSTTTTVGVPTASSPVPTRRRRH